MSIFWASDGKSGWTFVVTALPLYGLCQIEMCMVWGTVEGNACGRIVLCLVPVLRRGCSWALVFPGSPYT